MNIPLWLAAVLSSAVLTSCATTVAQLYGISARDIDEINRVVRATTSEQILSYRKVSEGAVYVEVRSQAYGRKGYVVENVKGKWQINHKTVIVES